MTKDEIDELLTKKEIRAILDYDPDTGVFRWKAIKRGRTVGSIAGGQNSRGYILIFIDGKSYRAHRLAFLYAHGYFPELIDHINGDGLDNKGLMMDFESRIHAMLDEIAACGIYRCSKYPIIEKYFKKIREDTKKECVELCTWGKTEHGERYPSVREVAGEIKKL